MSPLVHRIYIATLAGIVVFTAVYLTYKGFSYYNTTVEERFYHPDHTLLKSSGPYGHGLGIIGTLLILIGVFGYIAKKRYRFLARFGRLKYWLEFHIFLCTLGPVMILFHTAFKFGGIVSISFWSMVAVVASGVIGRFIYIQIPRTIEGRELSLGEIQETKNDINDILKNTYHADQGIFEKIANATTPKNEASKSKLLSGMIGKYFEDRKTVNTIKKSLREKNLPTEDINKMVTLIENEISINNKIARLQTMQKLFKYWHVAHLPFAIIMLIIMVIHVAITLAFGYKWIF
ncbi:MAG TPA: hypothetical protein PKC40_03215 [Saprospiraceae bacterium]|nr:hypothetical protein [Saprospiraceae bacterium]